MKKNFKYYVICWAIMLAVFNVVCFVTPSEAEGMSKFGGAFWTGYIFITIAFIGQLCCAFVAFKQENLQKVFYNIPLVTISFTGLIVTLAAGALCMAIPDLPDWVGIIVCTLVLAFTAIAVIKAKAAAQIVGNIDDRIKEKTSFINNAVADAESLVSRAKSDAVKNECKKVYESLRYSDPVSGAGLSVTEAKITVKMDELSAAVEKDDAEKAKELSGEIAALVSDRNVKCRSLK